MRPPKRVCHSVWLWCQDLVDAQSHNQDVVEKERQDLIKYKEDKNNDILSYNNQLAGAPSNRRWLQAVNQRSCHYNLFI